MNVTVIGNTNQPADRLPAISRLVKLLQASPLDVRVEEAFYRYLKEELGDGMPDALCVKAADITAADMALSVGGDGTLLRTAALIGDSGVPVAGINSGHLGYLAGVDIDHAGSFVADIVAGNILVEPRSMLRISVGDANLPDDFWPYALNEVAVLRHDTASMIDVSTTVNGIPLADYRGDGLIVSTPTGSTGYNLSVGGPVIEPTTPAWSIAPIAPHSLTMRPLIAPDSSVIVITTGSRADSFRLSLDGRSVTLPLRARITVSKAPFALNVVYRRDHSFAATLRHKLLWGSSVV